MNDDACFLVSWNLTAALSVFVPLIIFGSSRLANNYNGDGNQQNNNENNNYQNAGRCRWWQWGCNDNYNYENAEEAEDGSPWWWVWAEDERRREDVNPTLIIIYIWSVLVFLGIVCVGHNAIRNNGNLNGLVAMLLIFANLSFLSMLFLGGLEGGVQDEGRELDEHGWYGQMGVLMFITNLFWTVFAVVFAFSLRRKAANQNVLTLEFDQRDYKTYEEPTVMVTGKEVNNV